MAEIDSEELFLTIIFWKLAVNGRNLSIFNTCYYPADLHSIFLS
jgi:hypothetical protein